MKEASQRMPSQDEYELLSPSEKKQFLDGLSPDEMACFFNKPNPAKPESIIIPETTATLSQPIFGSKIEQSSQASPFASQPNQNLLKVIAVLLSLIVLGIGYFIYVNQINNPREIIESQTAQNNSNAINQAQVDAEKQNAERIIKANGYLDEIDSRLQEIRKNPDSLDSIKVEINDIAVNLDDLGFKKGSDLRSDLNDFYDAFEKSNILLAAFKDYAASKNAENKTMVDQLHDINSINQAKLEAGIPFEPVDINKFNQDYADATAQENQQVKDAYDKCQVEAAKLENIMRQSRTSIQNLKE